MAEPEITENTDKKPAGALEIAGGAAAGAGGLLTASHFGAKHSHKTLSAKAETENNSAKVFAQERANLPSTATTEELKTLVDKQAAAEKAGEKFAARAGKLAETLENKVKSPTVVFKEGTASTKAAILAALVVPAALAVYGINKYRNGAVEPKSDSFATRTVQEKAAAVSDDRIPG